MSLKNIYEDNINEFIQYGEFEPTDTGLSLVYKYLADTGEAGEILSDAINGDELLSQDVINWCYFENAGDQQRARVSAALCKYALYFVEKDADIIWGLYDAFGSTDPMTEAKERDFMDEIAGNLKGVF
tara:strand:+ start:261 stop:644 length:384 start_codon:yes stop_codon:yes gene_type:complete